MARTPEDTLTGPDAQAWSMFARSMREQRFSENTILSYAHFIVQLAGHLAGAAVMTATRAQVSDYLIHVGATRSASTHATAFRRLARFYRWLAEDEELIPVSPMAKMKCPRAEDKAPAILPAATLAAIAAACKAPKGADAAARLDAARDLAMLLTLCSPGTPRASELAAVCLDDISVDRDEGALAILDGKGGVSRVIPLDDAAARAWTKYLMLRALSPRAAAETARAAAEAAEEARRRGQAPGSVAPRERALLGKRGRVTRSGVAQIIQARADAAGVGHVHPHQFRHTTFDAVDNMGLSERAAARLYGWKSTKMASVYGRAAAGRRAVDAGRNLGLAAAVMAGAR